MSGVSKPPSRSPTPVPLLRLDPAVHDALSRWAADELRSTNAEIEFLLRRALADAGRLPSKAGEMRGRDARARPAAQQVGGLTAARGFRRRDGRITVLR
jgi:hypothetical protein